MGEVIKSYKGFNRDMTCNPEGTSFQYEEGREYEEDNAEACECGFHACEMPLDVFLYYPPSTSVYHEVEQSGKISRKEDDSKVASTKIKIGARLDIAGLVKAQIEYVKKRTNNEHTDPEHATAGNCGAATAGDCGAATAGYCGAATAGDCGAATAGYRGAATAGYRGAATAGDCGAATAGYCGAATAGDCGAATAGDCGAATAGNRGAATAGNRGAATAGYRGAATAGNRGAATAGYCGAATAGDCGAATAGYCGAATAGDFGSTTAGYRGAATAGDCGAATAGYRGAATAGDFGAATSRGKSEVGTNGLAVARGNNVKVKGGIGSILVIAEENTSNYDIADWKAVIVDGKNVKADTWYRLKDGELCEVAE